MAQLLASPVTLVVKAPNQKIDDQKVECTNDWTVNDLKHHLSKVYPTNPVNFVIQLNLCIHSAKRAVLG